MKIDIVIPWCGNDFDPKIHTSNEDLLRQSNNNELYYCLDSIKTFAPWINKIYILVNKINIPNYIPEPEKTIFIDRTKLLDNKKITNGLVAQSLCHKVKELSEYFLLVDDDIVLGRPTQISDFFQDDKPIYYYFTPTWGPFRHNPNHKIYQNSEVFNGKSPLSCGPYPHFYISMRKSFCEKIESEYEQWFKFMRSHKNTRFNSTKSNYSMEEDFKGVFISYINKNNLGINKEKDKYKIYYEFGFIEYNGECYDTRLSSDTKNYIPCDQSIANFKNKIIEQKTAPLFINFNSVHNTKDLDDIWEFIKYEKYKS
jgi:hypothetical protein